MSVAEALVIPVTVPEVWDTVRLRAPANWSVERLKREALAATVGPTADIEAYAVKFRGALIIDESATLNSLDVPDGAPFIVLRGHRRPVR